MANPNQQAIDVLDEQRLSLLRRAGNLLSRDNPSEEIVAEAAALRKTAGTLKEKMDSLSLVRLTTPDSAVASVVGPSGSRDDTAGFDSPRSFLLDVLAAGARGQVSERLRPLAAVGSDEHSGLNDPYGGFVVPSAFAPRLLQVPPEIDPLASKVQRVPMGAAKVMIPARVDKDHSDSVSGGLRVYRRAEMGAYTSSRMEFELVELQANSLTGLAYASDEVLADSAPALATLLERGFRDEVGAKIMNERLNGSGVGEYEGIMNSPALVTVAKEGSQAADSIVWANLVKMRARCYGYSGAYWLYNNDCLPALMQMEDSAGHLLYQASARDGDSDILLGRPAFATEFCATVGDVGDILLVNPAEYLEGTYGGNGKFEDSIHVRFEYGEKAFRFTVRNAGAGWWRSPLTPKNSTATLSPFVALAAR